jgi:transmembrane sensor
MDHCRDDSIFEQAQFWVVEVHDSSFSTDLVNQARFRDWLNRSGAHVDAYRRTSQIYRRLACLGALTQVDLDERIQRYRSEQEDARQVRLEAWFSTAAALLLGLVLAWVPQRLTAAPILYVTRVGEQRTVFLTDGSQLRLNSGTRILVQTAGRYREIDVLEGETYFAMVRDRRRPIRVFAAAGLITGDASEFDVSQLQGRVEVIAVRGELSVTSIDSAGAPLTQHITVRGDGDRSDPISLRASEIATMRVRQDGAYVALNSRTPADIERLLAWRRGLLAFSNQSAVDLVAVFNRYNRQQMAIADPDIAGLRLSGDFQFNDPASFILALQRVYPTFEIVAQLQPTGAIVLSRRASARQKSTRQGAGPAPM